MSQRGPFGAGDEAQAPHGSCIRAGHVGERPREPRRGRRRERDPGGARIAVDRCDPAWIARGELRGKGA